MGIILNNEYPFMRKWWNYDIYICILLWTLHKLGRPAMILDTVEFYSRNHRKFVSAGRESYKIYSGCIYTGQDLA